MLTPEQIQQIRNQYGINPGQSSQSSSGSPEFEAFKSQVLGNAPQETQTEPQSGLLEELKGRFSKIRQIFKDTNDLKITPAETGIQTVGQLAGGVTDIIGAGLRKIGDFIPKPVKEFGKDVGNTYVDLLKEVPGVDKFLTESSKAGLDALSKGIEFYQSWKKENPRAALNLESVVNIASILPAGSGAKTAVKEGIETITPKIVKTGLEEVAGAVEKKLVKSEVKQALDVVKPYLNKSDKIKALVSGRGKGGFLGGIKVEPSALDTKVAESVAGIVKPGRSPVKNIQAIQSEIVKEAEAVKAGLAGNDAIFNDSQLRSFLNSYKKDNTIIFGGDKSIETAYDTVINEYFKILKSKPNTLSGALEARKEFDNVVKSKFPNIFDKFGGDNVRANAVQDVRRGVNDFIASKLPDGNLFKDSLKKQSNMYKAITNIAENNIKLINESLTKRAVQALRKNVVVQGMTGGILTAAALSNVIGNPFVLGSLLAGGTVLVGKTLVSSRSFETLLKQALKIMKDGGFPLSDTQAIRGLIEAFDKNDSDKQIKVKPIK